MDIALEVICSRVQCTDVDRDGLVALGGRYAALVDAWSRSQPSSAP